MSNHHRYEKCCGRKIVSGQWNYCPFCGLNLESSQPAPDPTARKTARAATKPLTLRPDGSVRESPLKSRKQVLEQTKKATASGSKMCQHVCTKGPMKGQICGAYFPEKKGHRHRYKAKATLGDY